MTNLKPVNTGFNKFCGPAVLSILTGKNTDDCVQAIRRVYPQYSGAEVPYGVLLSAADKLGYDTPQAPKGVSLYGTIVRLAREDGIYVIFVPGHVVVVEVSDRKAYFCDNQTKEPIPASSSARLGQKVLAVNKFVERPKPEFIRYDIKVEINEPAGLALISRVSLYKDARHNTIESIGTIRYDGLADLSYIISVLKNEYSKTVNSVTSIGKSDTDGVVL